MTFVIFHKDTTRYLRIFRNRYWQNADFYKTEAAAKASLSREAKKTHLSRACADDGKGFDANDYVILPYDEFKKIEKTEIKHNLIGGGAFEQSVNTPSCCDPSTETYWST